MYENGTMNSSSSDHKIHANRFKGGREGSASVMTASDASTSGAGGTKSGQWTIINQAQHRIIVPAG
eukprot:m.543628 g.543628  ORF g.543628 m.543628 type:complete len:66 (+) comp57667_c0_seq67:150-347(+)